MHGNQATWDQPLPSNQTPVTRPDAELVARYRAGDLEVFEALYREHSPRIYSLARRMTGSAEAGEDLLQEIFLQAYRKCSSFKGDAAIGTWLYRLALNYCLDFVRSRQMKMDRITESLDARATTDDGHVPLRPDATSAPARAATSATASAVARLDLERALERLPAGYREAFVLHDVEGFDHAEVARMLGVAEGTSRSQVFKARMKLRALLGARSA